MCRPTVKADFTHISYVFLSQKTCRQQVVVRSPLAGKKDLVSLVVSTREVAVEVVVLHSMWSSFPNVTSWTFDVIICNKKEMLTKLIMKCLYSFFIIVSLSLVR